MAYPRKMLLAFMFLALLQHAMIGCHDSGGVLHVGTTEGCHAGFAISPTDVVTVPPRRGDERLRVRERIATESRPMYVKGIGPQSTKESSGWALFTASYPRAWRVSRLDFDHVPAIGEKCLLGGYLNVAQNQDRRDFWLQAASTLEGTVWQQRSAHELLVRVFSEAKLDGFRGGPVKHARHWKPLVWGVVADIANPGSNGAFQVLVVRRILPP